MVTHKTMKTDDDEIFKVMRDIIRWFTSKNPAWFKTCLEPFGIAAGSIASMATLCMTVVI